MIRPVVLIFLGYWLLEGDESHYVQGHARWLRESCWLSAFGVRKGICVFPVFPPAVTAPLNLCH